MRDPKRIQKFCNQLAEIWSKVPDWRFGQLVVNVLGRDAFYIEDDRAMKCFEIYFDEVYKKNKQSKDVDKTNNNYASILCEYCPYTEFGLQPSEYISGNATYVACEGRACAEAYENYVEITDDETPLEELF